MLNMKSLETDGLRKADFARENSLDPGLVVARVSTDPVNCCTPGPL